VSREHRLFVAECVNRDDSQKSKQPSEQEASSVNVDHIGSVLTPQCVEYWRAFARKSWPSSPSDCL